MSQDPTAAFQTVPAITTELINLSAILNLPKPTEAFMSDIHGEYDAFSHVLRNGSGNVKTKISECFGGQMTEQTRQQFAFLVYYPSEMVARAQAALAPAELEQWYRDQALRLAQLLAYTATKYTRSKVRKVLAPEFVYITEELLFNDPQAADKRAYYWAIIQNLIALGQVTAWIEATAHTIQQLTADQIHIIGDIYDRGPAPHRVVEALMHRGHVDFQWGNHDILWLGGAAGSVLNIANLVRICARYANLEILEDTYGINLRHLARLGERYDGDNPAFQPKVPAGTTLSDGERRAITQIHQAILIIQLKLEGPVIKRRPEFGMANRLLLAKLSPDRQHIKIDGQTYPLTHGCFDLVDPADPYRLTAMEQSVIDQLVQAFIHSEKLHRHMDFLVENGSMYRKTNGNLLIHGCVPVDDAGELVGLTLAGKTYRGAALFDLLGTNLVKAYQNPEPGSLANDLLWYLWTGPYSPLFGKQKMTTFERYFIEDKAAHDEQPNPYYRLRHEPAFVQKLLRAFGLDGERGHIINGHTPVKKGNSPIMANRQMLVIDGGFSRPYQKTTGIGGYTLLDNSYGMQLVAHQPFVSRQDAIAHLTDIVSTRRVVETEARRRTVAETDIGHQLQVQICLLKARLQRLTSGQ